jgi:hypothetical protein
MLIKFCSENLKTSNHLEDLRMDWMIDNIELTLTKKGCKGVK